MQEITMFTVPCALLQVTTLQRKQEICDNGALMEELLTMKRHSLRRTSYCHLKIIACLHVTLTIARWKAVSLRVNSRQRHVTHTLWRLTAHRVSSPFLVSDRVCCRSITWRHFVPSACIIIIINIFNVRARLTQLLQFHDINTGHSYIDPTVYQLGKSTAKQILWPHWAQIALKWFEIGT